MIKIAICDSDEKSRIQLDKLLGDYGVNHQNMLDCQSFESGNQLLYHIKAGEYDVILLEVMMPDINGIKLARDIREFDQNVKIIFLSTSSKFAVESYTVGAYCYLLKPATKDTLYPLLDRLFHELIQQEEESFLIKCRGGVNRIVYGQLEYVEVMNKTVFFHMIDHTIREAYGSLSDYEDELLARDEFIKVHRSYLMNLQHIQVLNNKNAVARSGDQVPVSRSMYPTVKELYMSYLFQKASDGRKVEVSNEVVSPPAVEVKHGKYEILLVDDEKDQLDLWSELLQKKGCMVRTADNAVDAEREVQERVFDCIILDVMMPELDGFFLCRRLKMITDAPVIYLSTLSDTENQLKGFQSGGIDYITKDTPLELAWTKIETRMNIARSGCKRLKYGPLVIDFFLHKVFMMQEEMIVTPTEFDLLGYLASHPEQTYTPEDLYQAVWGTYEWDNGQTLQVHMSRMRRKLEKSYPEHNYIETVWGKGYRFSPIYN